MTDDPKQPETPPLETPKDIDEKPSLKDAVIEEPSKSLLERVIESGLHIHVHNETPPSPPIPVVPPELVAALEKKRRIAEEENRFSKWKLLKLLIEKVSPLLLTVVSAWAGAYFVVEGQVNDATEPLREQVTDQAAELLILTKAEEIYRRQLELQLEKKRAELNLHPGPRSAAPVTLNADEVSQVQSQVQEELSLEFANSVAPFEGAQIQDTDQDQDPDRPQLTAGARSLLRAEATRKVTQKLDKWVEQGRAERVRAAVLREQIQAQEEEAPR